MLCRLSFSLYFLLLLFPATPVFRSSFDFNRWLVGFFFLSFSHSNFLLCTPLKCQLSKIYVTCIIAVKWVFFLSLILSHIGAFDLFPTIQICNGNRCLSFLYINIFGTYYRENEEPDSNNSMESNPINWASSYRVKGLSDCCHRNDLGQKITIQLLKSTKFAEYWIFELLLTHYCTRLTFMISIN